LGVNESSHFVGGANHQSAIEHIEQEKGHGNGYRKPFF